MEYDESEKSMVRDIEAIECLLRRPPKDWIFLPCPGQPELEVQLARGVQLTEPAGHFVALLCADCDPAQKYLVLRLFDLPHFVVAAYERISEIAER